MDTVTKGQLEAKVAERTGLPRASVKNVLDSTLDVIGAELQAGRQVNLTGWLKFGFGVTAPVKKGTPVRNPFTQESNPSPGKPAGVRVKVGAGAKLKAFAPAATGKVGKAIIKAKTPKPKES
jgi:nucleoid DNA-binding protein